MACEGDWTPGDCLQRHRESCMKFSSQARHHSSFACAWHVQSSKWQHRPDFHIVSALLMVEPFRSCLWHFLALLGQPSQFHSYTWLCFRSNFNFFYERVIGQGSQYMPNNVDILIIDDPKNQVFDQKHTFGEIVMSINMEMCNVQKKTLRDQPQAKK